MMGVGLICFWAGVALWDTRGLVAIALLLVVAIDVVAAVAWQKGRASARAEVAHQQRQATVTTGTGARQGRARSTPPRAPTAPGPDDPANK